MACADGGEDAAACGFDRPVPLFFKKIEKNEFFLEFRFARKKRCGNVMVILGNKLVKIGEPRKSPRRSSLINLKTAVETSNGRRRNQTNQAFLGTKR